MILWSLHLLVWRCGHGITTFLALNNDWHCRILTFKELLETTCRILSQVVERRGSFIFICTTGRKLGTLCHDIELLVILDIWTLFNHEWVPAVLSHKLPTKALLEHSERAGRCRIGTLLFFTITQRLETCIARALSWVLREHALKFLILNELILWIRVEDNIFILLAW